MQDPIACWNESNQVRSRGGACQFFHPYLPKGPSYHEQLTLHTQGSHPSRCSLGFKGTAQGYFLPWLMIDNKALNVDDFQKTG